MAYLDAALIHHLTRQSGLPAERVRAGWLDLVARVTRTDAPAPGTESPDTARRPELPSGADDVAPARRPASGFCQDAVRHGADTESAAPRASAARSVPTSADVARLAGVSRATVSYVLNNADAVRISEPTRRRVREAARELGHVPTPRPAPCAPDTAAWS